MYAKIKSKKRVSELWAERLVSEDVLSQADVERQAQEVWDNLTILHQRLKAKIAAAEHDSGEQGTGEYQLDRSPSPTSTPRFARVCASWRGAAAHARGVHRPPQARQTARAPPRGAGADAPPGIDWAHGEALPSPRC